ncbi:esterase family protein [Nocardia colli]|uniref:Esterase family protein n=1 Tax=Nocardia colli TaxID=2545717 RepID=A0A5N0E743_9NOCA|nr:alpha/beta hydrolase-fold protein [Nocardia colli]KAA8884766.1 esterase family protein [Nocardia colli]
MKSTAELSLLSGPLPWMLSAFGLAGALWLIGGAGRRSLGRAGVRSSWLALSAALAMYVVVERWWRPFPDTLPRPVYLWFGLAVWTITLLPPRIHGTRLWRAKALSLVAAAALVLASAVQVNLVFAAYPTVEDALGLGGDNRISLTAVPSGQAEPVTGWPLDSVWSPPGGLPANGRVVRAVVPGPVSRFVARPAEIYLPPAYFATPRPLLPVLVLLSGQPGSPIDWFNGGRLSQTMDAYAATHGGLAPVVVVADATGGTWSNPLCLDSRLGNVATYLAVDLRAWVIGKLQVDADPRRWAIGGISYGGTCALQMATNYPGAYPTFLGLSGDAEPSLGDRHQTVKAAFGADTAAFERVNPMTLLRTRRYPDSAGVLVTGTGDSAARSAQTAVAAAAAAAGMQIRARELPGEHSWAVWSAGLRTEMNWLATRLGVSP